MHGKISFALLALVLVFSSTAVFGEWAEKLRVEVVGNNSVPISGATVKVVHQESDYLSRCDSKISGTTDANGIFETEVQNQVVTPDDCVYSGTFSCVMSEACMEVFYQIAVNAPGVSNAPITTRFGWGRDANGTHVEIFASTATYQRVNVTLTNQMGLPIYNATVLVMSPVQATELTDKNGQVKFTAPRNSQVAVGVVQGTKTVDYRKNIGTEDIDIPVTVFQFDGTLMVRVVGEDNNAAKGAEVNITYGNESKSATTNETGIVEFTGVKALQSLNISATLDEITLNKTVNLDNVTDSDLIFFFVNPTTFSNLKAVENGCNVTFYANMQSPRAKQETLKAKVEYNASTGEAGSIAMNWNGSVFSATKCVNTSILLWEVSAQDAYGIKDSKEMVLNHTVKGTQAGQQQTGKPVTGNSGAGNTNQQQGGGIIQQLARQTGSEASAYAIIISIVLILIISIAAVLILVTGSKKKGGPGGDSELGDMLRLRRNDEF